MPSLGGRRVKRQCSWEFLFFAFWLEGGNRSALPWLRPSLKPGSIITTLYPSVKPALWG